MKTNCPKCDEQHQVEPGIGEVMCVACGVMFTPQISTRLLVESRADGVWYKVKGDMTENAWQFGGQNRSAAINQAYGRCFIAAQEIVEDTHTGERWQAGHFVK